VFGIIAQMLMDFNDSHTRFYPPERNSKIEYGWQMQTVGDDTYVIAVKPRSDAEAQGIKPGDRVLKLDGIAPTRSNLWIYYYIYNHLSPRPVVRMEVQGEQPRTLEVKARITERKKVFDLTDTIDANTYLREQEDEDRLTRHEIAEVGDVCIWRIPLFDLSQDGVDDAVNKVKKCKTLILDLRRNPGGAVETLKDLVGNFFDRDITIGTTKFRKEEKPLVGKTRGDRGFKNNLVVLVDSQSASAAEVFARIVQLEKRGTVIGDRTSGKVMVSRLYPHQIGLETQVHYRVSVTNADLLMSDGKSLEGSGVIPDEVSLPTNEDLPARTQCSRAQLLQRAAKSIR
jgi:carboxyl-terminal processing protease